MASNSALLIEENNNQNEDGTEVLVDTEHKEEFKKFLQLGKESVSILFAGKTGTGKSSLINELMGEKVAKVGMGPNAVTVKIKNYSRKFKTNNGRYITLKMVDMPGSDDRRRDREQLPAEEQIDIVIYCFNMTERLRESDITELNRFASIHGQDIWQHIIFALTHADEAGRRVKTKQKFNKLLESWMGELHKNLVDTFTFNSETRKEGIPVVPTGHEKYCPPDREDWFIPFWTEVLQRITIDAKPSFIAIYMRKGRTRINQRLKFPKLRIARDPENMVDWYYRQKVAGTASTLGICTLTGAVIGTGAGIVGGPIGMGVGCAVGTAAGFFGSVGSLTVGKVIHKAVKEYKEKKAEQARLPDPVQDNNLDNNDRQLMENSSIQSTQEDGSENEAPNE